MTVEDESAVMIDATSCCLSVSRSITDVVDCALATDRRPKPANVMRFFMTVV